MDYNQRRETYEKLTNIAYYLIIAFVSLLSVVFLPMVNSSLQGGVVWPTTPMAWAIWIASRAAIALLNIIIFYCFTQQAVVNIKKELEYIRANELMQKLSSSKGLLPRSPHSFLIKEWLTKGTFIFLGSLASVIVLAEAVLSFDLTQFLSYIFTICLGVITGYLTMRKHESYWVTEYPAYADYMWDKYQEEQKKAEELKKQNENARKFLENVLQEEKLKYMEANKHA